MKKIIFILIVFGLVQTDAKSESNKESFFLKQTEVNADENSNFCVKGIVEFFHVVDILKMDQMPTDEQWSSFIESPGYKELSINEFGKNYFKDLLIAIFKPSEAEKLTEVIEKYKKKGDYFTWALLPTIDGFKEADLNREEIMSFAAYLSSKKVLNDAEKYLSKYLPNAKIDDSFKINFIIFNDSRGYDPVIIGITNPGKYSKEEMDCFSGKGQNQYYPTILLLAHEAFHHYRNKMLVYNEPDGPEIKIIWALNKIENEGIADLINTYVLYGPEGCFSSSKQAMNTKIEQEAQYAIINSLNYLLTEISKNEDLTSNLAGAVNNIIPRSGHPTGYYMAKIIYSKLGSDYLKTIAANPFQFFVAYNKAAESIKDAPKFSQEAIDYIKKLEGKYTIK